MNHHYRGLFENWEIGIATNVVNKFKKQWKCLDLEGFDDLLQECLLHWHFTKTKYKAHSEASIKTFMSKVVQNRLRNIVEKYNSDKRRLNTESISLDEPLNSKEDTEPLVEEIPDKEDSIQAELKIDIVSVCQKLTPRQQILCDLLRSSFNIREISSELGVNRKRVYEEIHRIRTIFEDEGLKNYLL